MFAGCRPCLPFFLHTPCQPRPRPSVRPPGPRPGSVSAWPPVPLPGPPVGRPEQPGTARPDPTCGDPTTGSWRPDHTVVSRRQHQREPRPAAFLCNPGSRPSLAQGTQPGQSEEAGDTPGAILRVPCCANFALTRKPCVGTLVAVRKLCVGVRKPCVVSCLSAQALRVLPPKRKPCVLGASLAWCRYQR